MSSTKIDSFPGKRHLMKTTNSKSVSTVLEEERRQVAAARDLRIGIDPTRPDAADSLIGLAFSGGGIRSATFNLGILQALARERLLRAFDYVSTVSGGGYIGGWLMGWMHHQNVGIHEVEERLSAAPHAPSRSADLPEVHFLREYSNYLTPRKGLLSADFWSFVASYLRNTILNQIILVLALLSVLLGPRAFVSLLNILEEVEETLLTRLSAAWQPYIESQYLAVELGLVLILLAIVFIVLNLASIAPLQPGVCKPLRCGQEKDQYCWFTCERWVELLVVGPSILAAALFTYGLGDISKTLGFLDYPDSLYRAPLVGALCYVGLWSVAFAFCRIIRQFQPVHDSGLNPWFTLVTAAFAGGITGFLLIPLTKILVPGGTPWGKWPTMTVGTPAMIGVMLMTGVLHIGLMGRSMSDAHREWWGRLGGWLMIYGICWLALFGTAVYFPAGLGKVLKSIHGGPITASGVLLWIASTVYGVVFGKNSAALKPVMEGPYRERILHWLARITPYIFITGLLLGLSLLAGVISDWITGRTGHLLTPPGEVDCDPNLVLACLLFMAAAVALSWRVDINEFSIHYLYRNRLIRCYLGASVRHRKAHPFTAFSEADNLALASLRIPLVPKAPQDARPLPILNMSLNVERGTDLAVQARKARSFAFTPLYGGFTRHMQGEAAWESFFGPANESGRDRAGYEDGITLGTCIAISGAAASPNMGTYSDPALAFLMTLFDVRLGWWIGNPARIDSSTGLRKYWQRGSPTFGFCRLLCELLGAANDDSKYVYLSDGGHFENLGIYELVRRGCKVIVACDASCDDGYGFADLHNAIERCRVDFGAVIAIDNESSMVAEGHDGNRRSKVHFLTGTIKYPDSPNADGTIIYIKPTLVDGDPQDVLAYANVNPHFPHDSTANQWFDEAHFENYRALGETAAKSAIKAIEDAVRVAVKYDAHVLRSAQESGLS